MKHLVATVLYVGFCLFLPRMSDAADTPRQDAPNVIVIFIDDMGYGDVGFHGVTGAKTPSIDQMASEGMIFDDFYVDCAVCSGSRAALLTGARYQRLGMRPVLFPNSDVGLNPDEVTIAEVLKGSGYQTACVGKWHLGHLPPCLPTYHGFDSYFGIPYSNDMWIDPANQLASDIVLRDGVTLEDLRAGKKVKHWVPMMRGEEIVEYPTNQNTLTKRYTEEAMAFIRENKSQPFFLYLPHSMVHKPLAASPEFQGRTDTDLGDAIEEVDWSVGEIIQTLKEEQLAAKTLVIFTSDNGAAVGSSLPLRGKKASIYDGGIREPTVMWWPGKIPAGTTCTEVASSVDLLPTLARLCGGELPERKIDGKDIWPLMAGVEGAKSPHDAYVFTHGAGAVRSGKWKFYPWSESDTDKDKAARPRGRAASPLPVQLYDTDADVSESLNLAQQYPDVVDRLQSAYDSHLADLESTKRSPATMIRPDGSPSPDRPSNPKTTRRGTTKAGTTKAGTTKNPPSSNSAKKRTPKFKEYKSGIQWEEPEVVTPGSVDSAPPSDAVVLFGKPQDISNWKNGQNWKVEDGDLVVGHGFIISQQTFGDCQLHVEWSAPIEARGRRKTQALGNSGIFMMGIYEMQVLDSYQNETYFDGQAGAIYKQTPPAVNAMRPPGQWNSYDIFWTAPRFDDGGDLLSPAYITAMHNGVLILNHFEVKGDTPFTRPPAYKAHDPRGPIKLQDHGSPVRFRNIWVRDFQPAQVKQPN